MCHAVAMGKDSKAKKAAEQAEDRERMSRIVKRHEAAKKKPSGPREDFSQAAARIVKEATDGH
jgi:hypothetical protein